MTGFINDNMMWLGSLLMIGTVVLFLWWQAGPRRAVGVAVFLSLLVPEWVRWQLSDAVWFNVMVTATAFSLILYMCHSRSTYNFHLNWCDYAGMGMVATHIISDCFNDKPSLLPPLRAYGEWVLPYLAGRVALQHVGDARRLLPWAVGVTIVLSLFGLMEMFIPGTGANIFESLFQIRRPPDGNAPYDMHRVLPGIGADLQRAYGPTNHPMYFGVLMFLLFPWMLYASARAAKGQAPWWWRLMPWICGVGVLSSISRAPVLAIPIALYLMQVILREQWRPILLVTGAVAAIALFLSWGKIQYALETISREAKTVRMVKIHGEEYRFTGTSHRWLMFVAYTPALQRTGPFGYGTERCSRFPPAVPGSNGIPTEMFSVDNAFLLYTLRFGLFGLLFFTAMAIAAQWGYLQFALKPHAEGQIWLAATASTLMTMMLVLLTVWMPQDFGFFYMFLLGGAAGIWAEHQAPMVAEADADMEHREHSTRRRRRRRRSQDAMEDMPPSDEYDDAGAMESAPEEPPEEADEEPRRSSRRRSRRSRSHE